MDILSEYSDELVEETLKLAASKSAAEYDEYDHTVPSWRALENNATLGISEANTSKRQAGP